MILVDRDGIIRYWSADAERLTGHRASDVVGQTLDVVVPADYRERHWQGFRAAMKTGAARAEGAGANIPVLCANGSVRRWPARFTLIRDARGRPSGAAAVMVEPLEDDPPFFDLYMVAEPAVCGTRRAGSARVIWDSRLWGSRRPARRHREPSIVKLT